MCIIVIISNENLTYTGQSYFILLILPINMKVCEDEYEEERVSSPLPNI